MKLPLALFLVSFIAQAQPNALYYRTDYPLSHLVDGGTSGLVIADLNNDGKLDFVAGAGFGLDVALGNGDGTFKPLTSFVPAGGGLTAGAALSWSAADFDGDGNIDLALYSQGSVFLLPGNGDGTFGSARLAASGLGFPAPFPSNQHLQAADLNHDGHPDLVFVSSASSGTVNASATVLLNNGNGAFTSHAAFNLPANEYAVGVTIADFNRDGVLDLAVIGQVLGGFGPPPAVPGHVYIGLGKGDGSFSGPLAPVPLSATPLFIAAADFNHDGTPDLAIEAGTTFIFLGNGDGSFRAEPTLNIGIANPGSMAAGDWTGSGNPGLAIFSSITPAGIALFASNGDGTFSSAGNAGLDPHTAQITGLLSADLNGDGRPDLVVLGQANTASVLLNAGDSPPQIVLPVSAASDIQAIAPGSIATIFGQLPISVTQSNSASPTPTQLAGVSVNVQDSAGVTRTAPLFFVSPTQINLQIPAGTAPGVAQIGVVVNGAPPIPGVGLVRNVVPAIFTEGASAIAAAYAVTYGPDNQIQSQQLAGSCQSSCSLIPIPRPGGARVFLELYATGIRNHVSPITVSLMGGQGLNETVTPEYAGSQGQFDGLDQVNVEITSLPAQPSSPMGTIYNLSLNVDGVVSNTILFSVD
jgi:uncharacterized protein (TIGR03437 family)